MQSFHLGQRTNKNPMVLIGIEFTHRQCQRSIHGHAQLGALLASVHPNLVIPLPVDSDAGQENHAVWHPGAKSLAGQLVILPVDGDEQIRHPGQRLLHRIVQ